MTIYVLLPGQLGVWRPQQLHLSSPQNSRGMHTACCNQTASQCTQVQKPFTQQQRLAHASETPPNPVANGNVPATTRLADVGMPTTYKSTKQPANQAANQATNKQANHSATF